MVKKIMGSIAVAGVYLGSVIPAFAQTVDADVQTAIDDGVTNISTELLSNFASLLPIALGVLVSVVALYFVIRHFRGIAKT